MDTQESPNGTTPAKEYPPPPLVHWSALLAVFVITEIILERLLPDPLAGICETLLFDAWVIYLCLWIRKLDRASKSLRWALIAVGTELAADVVTIAQPSFTLIAWLAFGLGVVSLGFWIVLIFSIRYELERHYNEREPVGLHLGPVKTLLFSFIYFQYHLYDIAQFKRRQALGIVTDPSRTLLP